VDADFALLTRRERQVMGLVVAGKTSKQIAAELGLSPRTIDVHRAHLMLKMRTKTQARLVRLALTYGLHQAGDGAGSQAL
jgi:FixJ family two-component response regulator